MFRRMEDFRRAWAQEAEGCLKILDAIPDAALPASVAEGHRDLRRIAWHLVESLLEMPARMGLEVEGHQLLQNGAIQPPPATLAEIRSAYATASESLLRQLEGWQDPDLEREDDMYGERWKRGTTLFVLIVHQTHHRGQMTVLMRQAGLVAPGIYGPAKEGWGAYGMEAPRV